MIPAAYSPLVWDQTKKSHILTPFPPQPFRATSLLPYILYRESATAFTAALWAGSHRLCGQTAVGSQGQSSSTTVLLSTEMAFRGFNIVLPGVPFILSPSYQMSRRLYALYADRGHGLYVKVNSYVPSGISRTVLVHKVLSLFLKSVYGNRSYCNVQHAMCNH
jgi:hypothetical protein